MGIRASGIAFKSKEIEIPILKISELMEDELVFLGSSRDIKRSIRSSEHIVVS